MEKTNYKQRRIKMRCIEQIAKQPLKDLFKQPRAIYIRPSHVLSLSEVSLNIRIFITQVQNSKGKNMNITCTCIKIIKFDHNHFKHSKILFFIPCYKQKTLRCQPKKFYQFFFSLVFTHKLKTINLIIS